MPAKKTVSSRKVRRVLRRLGLHPHRGDGSGHEIWISTEGRRCRPVLRHKEIAFETLQRMGHQLETQGICSRRAFISEIKAA